MLDEPGPKDERTAVVTAVEKVLVDSTRPDPVFRDGAGAPARIEWRTSPLLHLLTSETAGDAIVDHARRCGTNTVQLVDQVEAGAYRSIRMALPQVKIVQVNYAVDFSKLDVVQVLKWTPAE